MAFVTVLLQHRPATTGHATQLSLFHDEPVARPSGPARQVGHEEHRGGALRGAMVALPLALVLWAALFAAAWMILGLR